MSEGFSGCQEKTSTGSCNPDGHRLREHTLKVAYANVRSLMNKLDELTKWMEVYHTDNIAVSETWLTHDIADSEVSLPDFTSYRCDREQGRGEGTLIQINTDLNGGLIEEHRTSDGQSEMVICRASNGAASMVVSVFYRSPQNMNTS